MQHCLYWNIKFYHFIVFIPNLPSRNTFFFSNLFRFWKKILYFAFSLLCFQHYSLIHGIPIGACYIWTRWFSRAQFMQVNEQVFPPIPFYSIFFSPEIIWNDFFTFYNLSLSLSSSLPISLSLSLVAYHAENGDLPLSGSLEWKSNGEKQQQKHKKF